MTGWEVFTARPSPNPCMLAEAGANRRTLDLTGGWLISPRHPLRANHRSGL